VTRFALKGLLGRKLRTALTAIAIVLGVTMVSGTYVLTDSIDKAFDSIFTEVREGSNVVVSGKSAFDLSDGSGATAPSFDESVLDDVRGVDGVQAAEGSVDSETAQFIGEDGKAIVYGGAPNLGFSIADGDSQFNPLTLVEGAWPGPGDVVVDESTADKEDFAVGEEIGVQAAGPAERLRISGIITFGSASSLGGATLAGFDLPTAQRLFDKEGKLDEIAVAARAGVSDQQLIDEIRPVLPDNTQVISAAQQSEEDAADTNEFITFLQGFLLAFAGIALFVGSFVIANSLSITIAQRTREFATIRTLGGSRRQVLVSIVIEALVVGILASLAGLFLGLGLARLLFQLFDAVGFTLPNSGLVFETRTIIVSLLVGVLVTLLASLRPAVRATRVPPIAAVREGATLPESRFARFRTVGSIALTALGFAALAYGLFAEGLGTTQLLTWMGLGALLIFLGVALFAQRIVRPFAQLLGWPATRIGGVAGKLARDNARRNPQRTASTASALMIGLALVTLVAVLAQGITSTFRGAVEDIFTSDYAITAQNNFSPIPTSAAEAERAHRRGADLRLERVRDRRRRVRRRRDHARLDRRLAAGVLGAGPRRGVHRGRLRRGPRSLGRISDHHPDAVGRGGRPRDQGYLRPTVRRFPVRHRDLLERALRRSVRVAAQPLLVREDGRRRHRREHGSAHGRPRRLPEREGADA
jgi:putative ABC transport system permease protein